MNTISMNYPAIISSGLVRYTRTVDIKRLNFIDRILVNSLPEDGKVLDVGCGNGNISLYLGSQGYTVCGVDISEKAIATARAHNTFKNVKFDVVSAEELVAEQNKYHAIICSEVLEHLNNPKQLLDTLYKLLTDDGVLIVTVPNGIGTRELLMTKPMQWMSRNNGILWKTTQVVKKALGYSGKTSQSDADNLEHVQFFTHNDLKRLSVNCNFRIKCIKHADFISDVFPFSMLTKRVAVLQDLDCKVADHLPTFIVGGFLSVWSKDGK